MDGLSHHKTNKSYYSIDGLGKRKFWGRDRIAAIDSFRLDDFPEWANPGPAPEQSEVPKPSKQRLADCLTFWVGWQLEGLDDPKQGSGYRSETECVFRRFIKCVGNKPISSLTADHFIKWERWVKRNGQSPRWAQIQFTRAKTVLRLARRKNPSWPWPDGLLEWVASHDPVKYAAPPSNRKPFEVETFHKILAVCEQWAATDPTQIDVTTQSGKAKRHQAKRKHRQGIQFAALLRLANCGLTQIDIARITWDHLFLDGPSPHMDFPRRKVVKQVGYEVPRLTPLLPSTVWALRRWHEFEPNGPTAFRNVRRGKWNHNDISDVLDDLLLIALGASQVKRLRTAKKLRTFKSLRNIGPTIRKRSKLPKEMTDCLLGHVEGGTNKFYEDEVDEHYLVPLVNLIGAEYFDGEQVGKPLRLRA